MADKVAVKALVAELLGGLFVTPTLWHGQCLPQVTPWPFPYVIKSRHGCGHFRVVRNAADHAKARALSRDWMRRPYGAWLDEWLYGEIPRGLLVEEYLGKGASLPVDYKIYVFGGRARFIQVHLERGDAHRWIVMDRDWQRQSEQTADPDPQMPVSLKAMLEAAEKLGDGFDFVRADFYEIAGVPRFGELTFYPGSGLDPFRPPRLDLLLGLMWTAALCG